MYETADMMGANKRKIIDNLLAEARAGRILETPEGNRRPSKPALATQKKPTPAARQASRNNVSDKAISASFKETLEKTERDLRRYTQQLAQLDESIKAMQMRNAPQGAPLMVKQKKEREEVLQKISALQGIRDRCKAQLGIR